MKKNIFKPLFLLFSFLILVLEINSQIIRYNLVSLAGNQVYFPKDNKIYINEILESKDKDKLLYLAEIYIEMQEEEQALYYFNSYKGDNWDFRNKIAEKLGADSLSRNFKKDDFIIDKEIENYSKIKSVDSLEQYISYFNLKENKEKNIYEKLFKYKYEKRENEFWELYNQIEKEVFQRNIIEEIFVFQVLKDDFDEAKKTSFIKPELFFDLINYMALVKVPNKKIKDFVEEFRERFPDKGVNELFKFELKYILSDNEKLLESEKFLTGTFDEEVFEEYYKKTKNVEFVKNYLKILVFEKANEKYINYLISLDKAYEDEKYLSLLFDKAYLFSYYEKNSKNIESEYVEEYINYLYENKNYKKLFEYRERLDFIMLETLYLNGFKEVDSIIKKKYPLELKFADLNSLRYFYFNENFVFNEILVKELERQKQLNPAETYYLSRYYKKLGQEEKAKELLYGLRENYNLEK